MGQKQSTRKRDSGEFQFLINAATTGIQTAFLIHGMNKLQNDSILKIMQDQFRNDQQKRNESSIEGTNNVLEDLMAAVKVGFLVWGYRVYSKFNKEKRQENPKINFRFLEID